MYRRRFVRSASLLAVGVAGIAGCSAPDGGEEGPTAEETDTETETEAEADGSPTDAGTETETTETGTEPAETGTEGGTATDDGEVATSYRFLGRVEAWIGEEPDEISDAENPTLELTADERYEVTWVNDDGLPHDFTIQDEAGENLEQSELLEEEGAETTMTFTATPEMTQYICTIHPQTMVGDIEVSDA